MTVPPAGPRPPAMRGPMRAAGGRIEAWEPKRVSRPGDRSEPTARALPEHGAARRASGVDARRRRRRRLVARHAISFGQTHLSRTTYFFCIGLLRFEVNAPTILSLAVAMH